MQAKHRAKLDDNQKELVRKKDIVRKAEKWALMTDEERELEREKGRLRKKRMRERKKLEDCRDGMVDAQMEYDKIEKVVRERKRMQERNGKEHLYDNLMAKRGMRELREFGRLRMKYKRKKRAKDNKELWDQYWCQGGQFRELLEKNKPDLAAIFKERDEKFVKDQAEQRKKREEERKKQEEIERTLDEKGRWKYDIGNEDYFWSIPDENGHYKSMTECDREFEAEVKAKEEAKEALLTPEEREEKKRKALEKKRKEKEEEERMLEIDRKYFEEEWRKEKEERRKEKKRKAKEKRDEELSKPIRMPKTGGKGNYEKVRDEMIQQRHDAMKESGLFTEKELKQILDKIL